MKEEIEKTMINISTAIDGKLTKEELKNFIEREINDLIAGIECNN